jgi:phosphinothricin acetyltransferase
VNLVIRTATPTDADAIAAIYAPYVIADVVSFEEVAPDGQEMARRIGDVLPRYPWLVAEDDGTILGYAYAKPYHSRAAYRFTVETTVYIANDMQRRGIGRTLYHTLLRTLTTQGFAQAVALITLPNDSSIEMHAAVGFQRAGVWRSVGYKHGEWRDVGLWQHSLAITGDPPAEPKPFDEVGIVLD